MRNHNNDYDLKKKGGSFLWILEDAWSCLTIYIWTETQLECELCLHEVNWSSKHEMKNKIVKKIQSFMLRSQVMLYWPAHL